MANWYLKRGDGESGPGTEDQIRAAFKKNALNLDSLVRREDSQEWLPLKDAGILEPEDLNPFLAGTNNRPLAAERGTVTGENSKGIIHKDMFNEKPRYARQSDPIYATFVERFAAFMIDYFVLGFAGILVSRLGMLSIALQMVLGAAYLCVLQHEWGYTIGKKIMGIHVEMSDRSRPDLRAFIIRYFASMLSGLVLFLGYFMALGDSKTRTLHDRIADTIVVKD